MDTRSGDHWVAWANIHARNSNRIEALEGSFRRSIYPPALTSNHLAGRAIDMDIRWNGTLRLPRSDGGMVSVAWTPAVNANLPLHGVGASYGVRKLRSDAPHWSFNGR